MDRRPRETYHARRRARATNRRRLLLALGISAAVLLVALVVVLRRGSPTPQQLVVQHPTETAQVQATATAQTSATSAPPRETHPAAERPETPPGVVFFDQQRITYEPNFYAPQIQAFLDKQPGVLKHLGVRVGDHEYSFAETLVGQTAYYSINPRVLLALLETQSKLLSTEKPSDDQMMYAMGYHDDDRAKGFAAQVRYAVRQLHYARRDYISYGPLTFADKSTAPAAPGMGLGEYMVARAIALTTTPERLPDLLNAFRDTYTRLFGDPGAPPADWPKPATAPFLSRPMDKTARVTSFFDHDAPFLNPNGSLVSYWGRTETQLSYDGHDGWDYALAPPEPALAAADGDVVFAGNADDNCATRAVIIDHGNGYRTLYWHLARIDVESGAHVTRGQPIGIIGSSGCAQGPHLHFGVQFLGRNTDPYGWCGTSMADPWRANPAGIESDWLWNDRLSPCAPPPENAIVVDTDSPGFSHTGDGWQHGAIGYGGGSLYVPSVRGADDSPPWELRPLEDPSVALYQPKLPAAGRYRVMAYVPFLLNGMDDAQNVRYRIHHSGGESEVVIDQETYANDWIDLGTFEFSPTDHPFVALSNLVEENQRGVWADAIVWMPASS
jgi:murein DD-endopeptidase MepM/ murein hydrolase activator NlpD